MTLLLILLTIKHFIVDAPLQLPYQYLNKGTYGHLGGILHAALHGIGTVLCLLVIQQPMELCFAIGFMDAGIHYHIDWAKMNISSNKYSGMSTDADGKTCLCIYDNMFFIWLVVDQCLHFATYILIVSLPILEL